MVKLVEKPGLRCTKRGGIWPAKVTTQSLVALLSKPWVMIVTPAARVGEGMKAARNSSKTSKNFFPSIAWMVTVNRAEVKRADRRSRRVILMRRLQMQPEHVTRDHGDSDSAQQR